MQTTAYKQQQKTDQLTAQTTYSGSLFWFGKVSFLRSSTASIISSSLFLMRTSLLRVADSAIQLSAKTNLHMLHHPSACGSAGGAWRGNCMYQTWYGKRRVIPFDRKLPVCFVCVQALQIFLQQSRTMRGIWANDMEKHPHSTVNLISRACPVKHAYSPEATVYQLARARLLSFNSRFRAGHLRLSWLFVQTLGTMCITGGCDGKKLQIMYL